MHFNVLVFPGGSEVGLEIQKALSPCKEVTLFSAGIDAPNHAPRVFRRHFSVPSIHEEGWLDALNSIIAANNIDYIYPAYDDIIVALSECSAAIDAKLVLPPKETCLLTRSKKSTYEHFAGLIPVPKIYDQPVANSLFPVFVKPDKGQGSQGAALVSNSDELAVVLAKDDTVIILEHLPGDEVTVDCFSDRERGVLFCGGRLRARTRSGISMAGSPISDPVFESYASTICDKLEIYGAWFFQLKKDKNGQYKLLEIAPRIAGAMALHRVTGVNFPLLGIYEQERIPVSILVNTGHVEIERALINRDRHDYHYSVVYVDLDDTLILNEKVNVEVVRLIYQSINQGIPVKLVTRHGGDLDLILRKHRLQGLFDEVLHLTKDEEKAGFIPEPDAIFIDDSFSERRDVNSARGVRTFDSSMLEVLFDDRK